MMQMARPALVVAFALYMAGFVNFPAPLIGGAEEATTPVSRSLLSDSGLTSVEAARLFPATGEYVANAAVLASADYGPAIWVPAASTNYSVFDRPDDYPIDMIVIHDIEGSATSAITTFQDPKRHGSAHYIVSYKGKVWQMVLEKDVAWHAGNWDYNTRSIGIENEGYAWTPGLYTPTEYRASAHIAASICSRYGVPLDRTHVIGHNQVPDPYHKGLYGGDDHHTDPGPYWDWSYYLGYAKYYAKALPSPPNMMIDPVAVPWDQSATVTWQPARSCHAPVAGYHVVAQPGNISVDVPGSATEATIGGLHNGTTYSFTVTASNPDGQSSRQSNYVIAGPHCSSAGLTSSLASPQMLGTRIALSATSADCPNPQYKFFIQDPSGMWTLARSFGGATWNWDTFLLKPGTYTARVWASQTGDTAREAFADVTFSLVEPPPCTSASLSPATASQPAGSTFRFTASATGCPIPTYEYWVQNPKGVWSMLRTFSLSAVWDWNTTGLAPGNYVVHVWANHPGHPTTYLEVVAESRVTLAGCTSATLSPASGSSAVGTSIKFTATSSGCPNPVYEFWLQWINGTWHRMTDFGGPTWTWKTGSTYAKGTYHIHVWANQQGAYTGAFETFGSSTYTLN
jgi:hypothetical protein